jgi:ABC-type multidrug transport system fused ATPase/permease subunit
MEFTSLLWVIFSLILIGGLGVLFAFFPGKVIQLLAKLQEGLFHITGVSDEEVDNLPIYSSFFGEDYSKRLKSEKETPEKHKFLIAWIKIFGFFILFSTLLGSCLFLMAVQTWYF